MREFKTNLSRSRLLALACLIAVGASAALYVRSFTACDSIALLDAGVTTDTGYVMVTVPLGKLTHDGVPQTHWKTARMVNGSWIWPGLEGKPFPTLRDWLPTLEQFGFWGKEFLGVGFWHAPQHSTARPHPYIVVYFPIPIIAFALLLIAYIGYRVNFKMNLKTLLAMPAIVAVFFACSTFLLTLRVQ